MTWLEPGYVSKKKGFGTWRIREWQFDKSGKRFKRTMDVIRTPLVFYYITNDKCSFFNFDYHFYFSFDIDGNYPYDIYVQVDDKEGKYVFLPEQPKHIEFSLGDNNE